MSGCCFNSRGVGGGVAHSGGNLATTSGGGSRCCRGKSCLYLQRLALDCALPGSLVDGYFVASTSICIANRGLFCVANCRNASPRPTMDARCNHNVSGKHCPAPEAMLFNLSISFWSAELVVGGVLTCLVINVTFAKYGSLSLRPVDDVTSGGC